jgi:cytochrome c peroxidase
MKSLLLLGVAVTVQSFVTGCAMDEAVDVEEIEEELGSNVTIPRVPNPPLDADLANLPGDLQAVEIPLPPNLGELISNRDAAVALGKALFWDMQAGSDGVQACASCHFHAGADPRSKNQLNPGLKHMPQSDLYFTKGGPNYQLKKSDFPLTRLAVPGVRGALDPSTDNNDVVASQGVAYSGPQDLDPEGFNVGDTNTRRVEPRNTPSIINAVFNHRQFWDGRADNVFNGQNHFGSRDPNARVVRADSKHNPQLVQIALVNASLASQALVPVLSDFEMSNQSRTMLDVAAHLLPKRPLAKQKVDRHDSVLGTLAKKNHKGLAVDSYADMVRAAFHRRWWDSSMLVRIAPDGSVSFVPKKDKNPSTREVPVIDYNFAMFFGLAIMMYEATLVSDETPWDRFRREHPLANDPALNPWTNTNPEHISRAALWGAMLFNDRSKGNSNVRCSNCHESAELTDASVRRVTMATNGPVRNRDGNIIDKGFNNIGVRPTMDDLGVGASDEKGPMSAAKRKFPGSLPSSFDNANVTSGLGIDGAFKIPSLRNVALTAPYFHNGDARTLREVIEFYSRGGNVAPLVATTGNQIVPLGMPNLTEDEIRALIAFLKSLTDERVLYSQAPFDHPQLFVPNGHRGDEDKVRDRNRDDVADDDMVEIEAVGAGGTRRPSDGFLEGKWGDKHGHHGGY